MKKLTDYIWANIDHAACVMLTKVCWIKAELEVSLLQRTLKSFMQASDAANKHAMYKRLSAEQDC